jgi:hypothetical protein
MRLWAAFCLVLIASGCTPARVATSPSAGIADTAAPARDPTVSQGTIVAVVRASASVDLATRPVVAPVAAGMDLVLLAGRAPGARPLNETDLAALGLTRDAAIALGKANALAGLRPINSVTQIPPPGQVGTIAGDYAEASRLLAHDDWAPLSQQMGGHLLVAVPAADTVLYTRGGVPGALTTLVNMARAARQQSRQPVSDAVLRWTASGWDVVAKGSGGAPVPNS